MSRELLLSRLGDHLNVAGQERELAVNTLFQYLVARLKFDQSIRIRGIGAFQLKKEPLPRVDRATKVDDGPLNRRTLVYAPIIDELSKDVNAAFVSFDLDELKIDSNDYLEKVFSLNIDKPLIPIQGSDSSGFESKDSGDEHVETLEEKIEKMVSEGEILQDYNIFENYILSEDYGETTDEIEEDELVKEELLKSIGDEEEVLTPDIPLEETDSIISMTDEETEFVDESAVPENKQLEEEIVDEQQEPEEEQPVKEIIDGTVEPETEQLKEEIVDEHQESEKGPTTEDIIDEAGAEIVFGDETTYTDQNEEEEIIIGEPETESEDEELLDELTDLIQSEDNVEVEDESDKEDLFAKLENYLKDEGSEEEKPENEQENNNSINESEEEELNSDFNKEEEVDDELNLPEDEEIDTSVNHTIKPFYAKPVFIVSLFSIVVITILIFVFRGSNESENSETSSSNEIVTETQMDQDQSGMLEQSDDSLNDSNVETAVNVEKTGMYRDIPNDVQKVSQVYFDGSQYTVQTSSWKSKEIAETQVEKLRAKGFDAFIFKVYLDSKKSMWHRVRIGYFNSVEEAEDFIIKNKF